MCAVSMVGDYFKDKWIPYFERNTFPSGPFISPLPVPSVSPDEFLALKREVEEMKELLKRAKVYDEEHGEPECEMEEKLKVLRAVAKAVGVDLEDVLKAGNSG